MRVINAMFSSNLGGIEQAFVDYCIMLTKAGHKVTAIILPNAKIKPRIIGIKDLNIIEVNNSGNYDLLAKSALKKIVAQLQAEIIICHGTRAGKLLENSSLDAKKIGVLHNYSIKRFQKMDYLIAVTKDLKRSSLLYGWDQNKVFHLPNVVNVSSSQLARTKYNHPIPVIGTIGRFVDMKGFDHFLNALALLKIDGIKFKAVLAGDGEDCDKLKLLCNNLDLNDEVEFLGWISDKDKFYNSIDIYCLPSKREVFGIVLLEALAYGLPIVSTNSKGPSEILTDGVDSLMVTPNDHIALYKGLAKLLADSNLAHMVAGNTLKTIQRYNIDKVSAELNDLLNYFHSA